MARVLEPWWNKMECVYPYLSGRNGMWIKGIMHFDKLLWWGMKPNKGWKQNFLLRWQGFGFVEWRQWTRFKAFHLGALREEKLGSAVPRERHSLLSPVLLGLPSSLSPLSLSANIYQPLTLGQLVFLRAFYIVTHL